MLSTIEKTNPGMCIYPESLWLLKPWSFTYAIIGCSGPSEAIIVGDCSHYSINATGLQPKKVINLRVEKNRLLLWDCNPFFLTQVEFGWGCNPQPKHHKLNFVNFSSQIWPSEPIHNHSWRSMSVVDSLGLNGDGNVSKMKESL